MAINDRQNDAISKIEKIIKSSGNLLILEDDALFKTIYDNNDLLIKLYLSITDNHCALMNDANLYKNYLVMINKLADNNFNFDDGFFVSSKKMAIVKENEELYYRLIKQYNICPVDLSIDTIVECGLLSKYICNISGNNDKLNEMIEQLYSSFDHYLNDDSPFIPNVIMQLKECPELHANRFAKKVCQFMIKCINMIFNESYDDDDDEYINIIDHDEIHTEGNDSKYSVIYSYLCQNSYNYFITMLLCIDLNNENIKMVLNILKYKMFAFLNDNTNYIIHINLNTIKNIYDHDDLTINISSQHSRRKKHEHLNSIINSICSKNVLNMGQTQIKHLCEFLCHTLNYCGSSNTVLSSNNTKELQKIITNFPEGMSMLKIKNIVKFKFEKNLKGAFVKNITCADDLKYFDKTTLNPDLIGKLWCEKTISNVIEIASANCFTLNDRKRIYASYLNNFKQNNTIINDIIEGDEYDFEEFFESVDNHVVVKIFEQIFVQKYQNIKFANIQFRLNDVPISELIQAVKSFRDDPHELSCRICTINKFDHVFTECGHVICESCYDCMNGHLCPYCRSDSDVIQIFK